MEGSWSGIEQSDAKHVVVCAGAWCSDAKHAVDSLRARGVSVGLMRMRFIRPFPRGGNY
jgi:pyruvate ferredoxin oxidoreductase alpha subunit